MNIHTVVTHHEHHDYDEDNDSFTVLWLYEEMVMDAKDSSGRDHYYTEFSSS